MMQHQAMAKHTVSAGVYEIFLGMIMVLHFIREIRIYHIKEENRFLHTENNMHIVMES